MELHYLDLIFSTPFFQLGNTLQGEAPFFINFKYLSSPRYFKSDYFDLSKDKWCIRDLEHEYHLLKPEKIGQVTFYDSQLNVKYEADYLVDLFSKLNAVVKDNIAISKQDSWPYLERTLSIDNGFERILTLNEYGKLYFKDIITYLDDYLKAKF